MASRQNVDNSALKKLDELDVGALVVSTAVNVVKKRPVGVSIWVLGLLMAAFAKGFAVDDATLEQYTETMKHAEAVTQKELARALGAQQEAQQRYDNVAGWFSCDTKCQKAKDKLDMAKAEVGRIDGKRQKILTDARREVGIWSVFGVQDVRNRFWAAWKSGKDMAARMTMMDAFMMAMPGSREENMMSVVIKLVLQYIVNLTMGLFFSMIYFIYSVYGLIVAYGESFASGAAFFLLVVVASFATIGTYLGALVGTVAGGGLFLAKQAAKQAAMEDQRGGGARRQVRYDQHGGQGGGRPGYGGQPGGRPGAYRPHGE